MQHEHLLPNCVRHSDFEYFGSNSENKDSGEHAYSQKEDAYSKQKYQSHNYEQSSKQANHSLLKSKYD